MAKQSHLAWRLLSEDVIFLKTNSENEMNYQIVSPPGPNRVWGIQSWSSHFLTLYSSVSHLLSYRDTFGSILINYFVSWTFCTFIIAFFFIAKFTSKTILINNYKFQEASEVARKSESPFFIQTFSTFSFIILMT